MSMMKLVELIMSLEEHLVMIFFFQHQHGFVLQVIQVECWPIVQLILIVVEQQHLVGIQVFIHRMLVVQQQVLSVSIGELILVCGIYQYQSPIVMDSLFFN